jgi:hypothetical protein
MAGARRGFPPARFEGVGIFGVGIFSPTGSIPDDKAQIDGRVFSACEAEPAEAATDPGTRWAAAIEVWPDGRRYQKNFAIIVQGEPALKVSY